MRVLIQRGAEIQMTAANPTANINPPIKIAGTHTIEDNVIIIINKNPDTTIIPIVIIIGKTIGMIKGKTNGKINGNIIGNVTGTIIKPINNTIAPNIIAPIIKAPTIIAPTKNDTVAAIIVGVKINPIAVKTAAPKI